MVAAHRYPCVHHISDRLTRTLVMRSFLLLLGLGLAACSSGPGADTTSSAATDSGSIRSRIDNLNKPAITPLGSAADRQLSADRAGAPMPATAEAPPPTSGLNTWPAPFEPTSSTCTRVATRAATILTRPRAGAPKFGQLTVGDHLALVARTADGWVGFNPHSAQAGNSGIFRLRWVRATEAFAPGDSCTQLPVVQAPPLGCLLMAQQPIIVHQQPASGASVLGTIPRNSYAQVVSTSIGRDKWLEIVVPGRPVHGYVAQTDANLNGDCR